MFWERIIFVCIFNYTTVAPGRDYINSLYGTITKVLTAKRVRSNPPLDQAFLCYTQITFVDAKNDYKRFFLIMNPCKEMLVIWPSLDYRQFIKQIIYAYSSLLFKGFSHLN